MAGEASKHGFPPVALGEAVRPLAGLEHLRIVGLMAMPPQGDDAEASRPWFRRLRELRDELAARPEWAGFPGLAVDGHERRLRGRGRGGGHPCARRHAPSSAREPWLRLGGGLAAGC